MRLLNWSVIIGTANSFLIYISFPYEESYNLCQIFFLFEIRTLYYCKTCHINTGNLALLQILVHNFITDGVR